MIASVVRDNNNTNYCHGLNLTKLTCILLYIKIESYCFDRLHQKFVNFFSPTNKRLKRFVLTFQKKKKML